MATRPSSPHGEEHALRRVAAPTGNLSDAVMQTLAEESPDAIVVVDVRGRLAWGNRQAEQLFGYGRAELLGQAVELLLPDGARKVHRAHRAAYLESPRTRRMGVGLDLNARRRDGATFPVEISLTPLLTDSGQMVIATVRDISERQEIAGEQAALRRVATLVARGVPPEETFAVVTEEAGRVLDADFTSLVRYDPDGRVTLLAAWTGTGCPWPVPVGSRWDLGGGSLSTLVSRTLQPVRLDGFSDDTGLWAADVLALGVHSAVAVPISVEGQLWGLMSAFSTHEQPMPAGTEARLAGFTQLVATAIANAQARVELRGFAEEQAALQRVATLVARGTSPEQVFAAVTAEARRVLGVDFTTMSRYLPDGAVTIVGVCSGTGTPVIFPVGTRLPAGGPNMHTQVFQTRQPARLDTVAGDLGPALAPALAAGIRTAVGVPISVEGRLWGLMNASSTHEEPLPSDTEARLAGFTQLVATAIANAQARGELDRFAEEQAALRRVATLVARGVLPEKVFAAVAEEVGRVLGVDYTAMSRYEPDSARQVVAAWARSGSPVVRVGTRELLGGPNVPTVVFETGLPARIDRYSEDAGPAAVAAVGAGVRSAVGVPIRVEGQLWGLMNVYSTQEQPLPESTEARLAGFTELVATAIANAEARAALTASRARIVATADATRRHIERGLHDGAQQRLVSLALQLRTVQATVAPDARDLARRLDDVAAGLGEVVDELREISRGIHPAALAEGGLGPALKALARRSAVPVRLDVRVDGRLPEQVELAAYYVVSEALTNTTKHAAASQVRVDVQAYGDVLRIEVRDDGRGGATFAHGSGLVGLKDRVEALGGEFFLHSQPDAGTTVAIAVPIDDGSETRAAPAGARRPWDPGQVAGPEPSGPPREG